MTVTARMSSGTQPTIAAEIRTAQAAAFPPDLDRTVAAFLPETPAIAGVRMGLRSCPPRPRRPARRDHRTPPSAR